MSTPAPEPPDDRPRVGRPPRINRQMIAEAAHELGLDKLTLKAVADHLDVSIAALYHHVSGKDDLLRIAAEYSATKVPLPEDRGQHWAVWLLEWARYNRDAFVAEPGLITQYVEGAIAAESWAGNIDAVLGLLVRQGFTIEQANDAYELVSACGLGVALGTVRELRSAESGQSTLQKHRDVLAAANPEELPYLRQLLGTSGPKRQSFDERIVTVLRGVAARQGLDWEPIGAVLDAELRRRRR